MNNFKTFFKNTLKSSGSILLVDDDADTVDTLTRILKRHGYSVDSVLTGQEGVARSTEKMYDLILLDINMPEIDGIDVLKQLRQLGALTPVVVISGALADRQTQEAVMSLGANAFYQKEKPTHQLVKSIRDILGARSIPNQKKNRRIMIIDDNVAVLEMLKGYLEEHNFDIFTFDNGRGVVSEVDKIKPAIIFLDIVLADYDGIEILDAIRQKDQDVHVIMLTGVGDDGVCQQAIKKGANDFITKPFVLDELRSCLVKYI